MLRIARFTFVTAVALGALSCGAPPAGPSVSGVALRNITLQPTEGNTGLCCCRVVGVAANNNDVPVHLTIKFSALEATREDPFATILAFVPDLQPQTQRPINAAGFIFPCSAINRLRTEVDVSGIAFPPV